MLSSLFATYVHWTGGRILQAYSYGKVLGEGRGHWKGYCYGDLFKGLSTSLGQVWVINSNFVLQLNLCVCYRENQFGLIVGPGRALLTLARSHICQVNKFVRKKNSLILVIVTGTFNRPVRWFINSMLSKWTRTLGGCKDCRPYSH